MELNKELKKEIVDAAPRMAILSEVLKLILVRLRANDTKATTAKGKTIIREILITASMYNPTETVLYIAAMRGNGIDELTEFIDKCKKQLQS